MPSRRELANAIRALTLDAVAQANSGHTGMPLGMADIAEVLWNDFLVHNPANPHWFNRDRFMLSNGHGSMLHYSLLHLTGYDLPMEEIKNFRQLHSKTPGHPEFGITPGIETTTGPLGQGLANGVGMAIAERQLAAQYNRPNHAIIDHHTYVFCGDGCLMEGISHEVCSLAGTLGLGKLIVFYDDNGISIDGHVHGWFRDDAPMRFRAYGWHVIDNVDGHDPEQIRHAIIAARNETAKPTIICCQTTIAYGAPTLANTNVAHGAITDADEIAGAKKNLNWHEPPFHIPQPIYAAWNAREKGADAEQTWQQRWQAYQTEFPKLAQELERRRLGQLPENWNDQTIAFIAQQQENAENIATRKASQQWLSAFAPQLPELLGGSADLTGSNGTRWNAAITLDDETPAGNYLYYGVREFGMSAIMNGLALHGGIMPFGGTFLVFLDYARNAIRMAALMQQRVVFIYSHDSIGVGEDGPTHQPIEHLSSLRATPNLDVWRPADATETAVAWQQILERQQGPSALILTRQNATALARTTTQVNAIQCGGYILLDAKTTPELILIATGSEVSLALDVAKQLQQKNVAVRVVSMPCVEMFLRQDNAYQTSVLPPQVTRRIAIEAGAPQPWYQFVGLQGKVIGLTRFGESAPYKDIFNYLGFSSSAILTIAQKFLGETV